MTTMGPSEAAGLTAWEFAHKPQEQHLSAQERYVAADVCDVLAVNLLGALPPNQRGLLEHFPVIVLPTRRPNALCIAAPSGGAVIGIDYGLLSFLNVLNKILLCRLNIFGLEPSLDAEAAKRMTGE